VPRALKELQELQEQLARVDSQAPKVLRVLLDLPPILALRVLRATLVQAPRVRQALPSGPALRALRVLQVLLVQTV
jgi:hypothetical protein